MKRSLPPAVLCALVLVVATARAQAPSTMSYQGVLTDAGGVIAADGNYDLTFRIFDVPAGGAPLWTEVHNATTVSRGGFNVILGGTTPLALAFDRKYYLGIEIFAEGELVPRVELTSAPYSHSLKLPFAQTLASASPLVSLKNTGAGAALVADGTMDVGGTASGQLRLFRSGIGTAELAGSTNTHGALLEFRDEAGNLYLQLAPDGDGEGGFLNLFRNTASSGIQLIGNFASTQEPSLQITGSVRSALFNMAGTGNSSVTLPADAIASNETFDEPGVANVNGNTTVALDGTTQTILSRSITVPAEGWVMVIGSLQVNAQHTNGAQSLANFGVSDLAGTLPLTQDMAFQVPSGAASGLYASPVTVHGLFTVASTGTYTFYLLGDETAGDYDFVDRELTLLYFPTAYGSVSGTEPPVAQGMNDERAGRALMPADVRAEQDEARVFHAARLEREMREMRAQLDRMQRELAAGPAPKEK